MKTFEKLENRYIFTGTLVLKEAMHVGSGEGDERADSLFVKSKSTDQFYIPGPSLRGALRSMVERIAYTLDRDTCLLFDGNSSTSCVTANPKLLDTKREEIEQSESDEEWDESAILSFLKDGHLCDTCKVFGSTHFASKVKITDLYLTEVDNNNPQGVIRHGVGIDRDTETASQGALFEIEVLEMGYKFDFELIAENLSGKEEWGLLCVGLWEMMRNKENGGVFYIGANSASGLGRCQLTDLMIKYFDQEDENHNLMKYLSEDKLGCISGDDAKNFVHSKVKEFLK